MPCFCWLPKSIRLTLKMQLLALWRLCGRPMLLEPGDAVILTYHRVLPDEAVGKRGDGLAISASVFAEQVAALKRHFTLIPLPWLVRMHPRDRQHGPFCALTFDDGWMDNYQVALPVLQRLAVPVTIFVCSGFVDTDKHFWWQSVSSCLELYAALPHEQRNQVRARLAQALGQEDGPLPGDSFFLNGRLIGWCKRLNAARLSLFVETLADAVGQDCQKTGRHALTSQEIAEIQQAGSDFGAHTVNHVILPVESEEVARQEIFESVAYTARLAGADNVIFAYPNGDFGSRDIALVREAGCLAAVTEEPGFVPVQPDNLFTLPRLDTYGKNTVDKLLFAVFLCSLKHKLCRKIRGWLRHSCPAGQPQEKERKMNKSKTLLRKIIGKIKKFFYQECVIHISAHSLEDVPTPKPGSVTVRLFTEADIPVFASGFPDLPALYQQWQGKHTGLVLEEQGKPMNCLWFTQNDKENEGYPPFTFDIKNLPKGVFYAFANYVPPEFRGGPAFMRQFELAEYFMKEQGGRMVCLVLLDPRLVAVYRRKKHTIIGKLRFRRYLSCITVKDLADLNKLCEL